MSFERRELGNPSTKPRPHATVKIGPVRQNLGSLRRCASEARSQFRHPITIWTTTESVTSRSQLSARLTRPIRVARVASRPSGTHLTQPSKLRMIWVYRCLDLPDH